MESATHRHYYPRTVVFPFLLIGLGIVALLVNAGTITWDSLGRIAGLWPLLLVLVGVELILSRTLPAVIALPANMAISALAVIGLVALLISGVSFSFGGWWGTAPVQTISRSAPASGLSRAALNLNYGAAEVTIRAADLGTDLYQAHLTYAGSPAPTVRLDQATGTLQIDRGNRGVFQTLPPGTHERVDLVISNRIPWSVSVNTGASQQTIDLRGVNLTSLRLTGGASSAEIRLPKPVGSMPIRIDGGAMSLRVLAPTGAAVQASASGGLTSLTCDGQSVGGIGRQSWQSANYADSTDRIDLQFSGGASSVRLERW